MSEKGQPLPKFGEWDVNDPTSAEGFTAIFNKARVETKTGGTTGEPESSVNDDTGIKPDVYTNKTSSRKWFCCMQSGSAES